MTVEDWMRSKTKGHTFKQGSGDNHNIVGRLSDRLTLKSATRSYVIEAGVEYCIFRKLEAKKYDNLVAVSFFISDREVLNVYSSGLVKRRIIASSFRI